MPHYQSCSVRNYLKKYQKFFIFTLGVRKCTMVFFHQESIRDFFKGVKSCDSRSNQASFQNIKNFQGIIFSENITIFFRNNFCLVLGLESAPERCRYHYSNTCVVLLVQCFSITSEYMRLVKAQNTAVLMDHFTYSILVAVYIDVAKDCHANHLSVVVSNFI